MTTTITIELPENVSAHLQHEKTYLPELFTQSLYHSSPVVKAYQYVLDFITSFPSPEQIAAFHPTPEMIERRRLLVAREHSGEITTWEKAELDNYDRLEHAVVMMKAGNLPFLTSKP